MDLDFGGGVPLLMLVSVEQRQLRLFDYQFRL